MKFIKKIFSLLFGMMKFFLKRIAIFIINFLLTITVIVFIIAAVVGYQVDKNKKDVPTGYIALDLSKGYSETVGDNIIFDRGSVNFYNLLKTLREGEKDSNIKGLVVKDSVNLSYAQIEELGEVFKEYQEEGKKVYFFMRNLDKKSYTLALKSDKITFLDAESAGTYLGGYHYEGNYYKNLFDFLGVKYRVLHIGSHKTFGENYGKDSMSNELREEIVRLNDTTYEKLLDDISKYRKIDRKTIEEKMDNGDYISVSPKVLLRDNLVDELSSTRDFYEINHIGDPITFEDYFAYKEDSLGSLLDEFEGESEKSKIAVIPLEGAIYYNDLGNRKNINVDDTITRLKEVETDDTIKGVVLRINSPGGSALASEVIADYVATMKKPVYVSIGGVAASGGYYIASQGDKIYGEESSITGSIGVVSVVPNIKELKDKLKINTETITRGKYSDIYSLYKPLDEEGYKRLENSSIDVYNEFKERVSEGRGLPIEEVEEVAQGQVWLGSEGIEKGLIDEKGGLLKTIDDLGKSLKLEDYEVVEIGSSEGILKTLEKETMGLTSNITLLNNFIETSNEKELLNKLKVENFLLKPSLLMIVDVSE